MTKKQIIAAVKAARKRLAKERDNLNNLIDEMESLRDDADGAERELQSAIDILSETL